MARTHPNQPKISDILRQLMAEVGITEASLARKANIPQPTLHRILSGSTRAPRADSLSRLANFFSISISQLVGDAALPKDRIPGTHNSAVHTWITLPIIDWDQACQWPSFKNTLLADKWENWVTSDANVSENSFALRVKGEAMAPRFPDGTLLIIDPELKPDDQDYVIIRTGNQKTASFKQLLLDGGDQYLKPLNPEFNTTILKGPCDFLGVMVQARMDYRKNQH